MGWTALLLATLAAALPAETGTAKNPHLDELSGLALSRRDPSLLWGHNDSGSLPMLYRIGLHGEDLGRLAVADAEEHDWEDIAAFQSQQGPALLIADTGDNFSLRSAYTLYAVLDPGWNTEAAPLWRLDFRYPDGAHDCEAVAVDEAAREILLVTKRDVPPRLYALPLPAAAPSGMQVARLLGVLSGILPVMHADRFRAPLKSLFYQSPTALDIAADGRIAVVLTPRSVYRYRRKPGQDWGQALLGVPQVFALPLFEQTEAGALSADGRDLYVGSEGDPAPFARVRLPP